MIQRSGLRYLVFEGKQIEAIRFYDADGVWLTIPQGWLEHCPVQPEGDEYQPQHDVTALSIDVVRANKENFKRSDNYVVSIKGIFSWKQYTPVRCLYIYMAKVSAERFIKWQDETSVTYYRRYHLRITGTFDAPELDEMGKLVHNPMVTGLIVVTQHDEVMPTELGAKAKRLAEQMNEVAGTKLDEREVAKLLAAFNITRK
jgi:hypothetical protein